MQIKSDSWPNKKITILSEDHGVAAILKELLRSVGWQISSSCQTMDDALESFKANQSDALVIDDCMSKPSAEVVRRLMMNPLAFSTPIMVFVNESHRFELQPLTYFGYPETMAKPITPARFVPKFLGLISRWETPSYTSLREASYEFHRTADKKQYLISLSALDSSTDIAHLSKPISALLQESLGNLYGAEKILLQKIKMNPMDLGPVLTLGDFYLRMSMPLIAKRLFLGTQNRFEFSSCLLPDMIQAHMMMGQLPEAIAELKKLHFRRYLQVEVEPMLSKLLIASGQAEEAKNVLSNDPNEFQKMKRQLQSGMGQS